MVSLPGRVSRLVCFYGASIGRKAGESQTLSAACDADGPGRRVFAVWKRV